MPTWMIFIGAEAIAVIITIIWILCFMRGGDNGIAKALYPLILLSFRLLLSTRPLFCLQLTSYRLSLRL